MNGKIDNQAAKNLVVLRVLAVGGNSQLFLVLLRLSLKLSKCSSICSRVS